MIDRRTFLAAASAAAMLGPRGAFAQSDGEWQKIVEAARQEGNVILYTAMLPATIDRLTAAFMEAYPGITLSVIRNIDAVLIPRLQQEIETNSPGADVYAGTTANFIDDLMSSGNLETPVGSNVAAFPQEHVRGGQAVVVQALPIGFAYNTDLVSEPPRTYADFLKPEFKGQISIVNGSTATVTLFWWDSLRKHDPDYWEKLKEQDPRFFPSAAGIAQSLAAGETAISPYVPTSSILPLIEEGAPVSFLTPEDAKTFAIDYWGMCLKNARNPNAAQVLVDYMASREGQEVINSGLAMSHLDDIPGTVPQAELFTYNPAEFSEEDEKRVKEDWETLFR